MATIESIKRNKSMKAQPYPSPLRVKILDKINVADIVHLMIGDKTGVMKLVASGVWNNENFPAVGSAVILRNYTKGHTCLFTSRSFTITKARDFEIPPSIEDEGKQYLHPLVATHKLKDVDETMLNKVINVEGTVVGVRHILYIKI